MEVGGPLSPISTVSPFCSLSRAAPTTLFVPSTGSRLTIVIVVGGGAAVYP
jgi:hypothetical protein